MHEDRLTLFDRFMQLGQCKKNDRLDPVAAALSDVRFCHAAECKPSELARQERVRALQGAALLAQLI